MNDTIQQDVSGEVKQQVVTSPQMQQRDRTFSEILARSEEVLDRQIAGNMTTEPTEPTVQVVDDPARFKVRVKVDGQEKELLVADVVTGYQKNEVASERLRKASERGRELDAREEALRNLEAQIKLQTVSLSQPSQGAITVPENGDDLQVQLKSAVSDAFSAMVDGDTEAATKLLVDAIVKGRPVVTETTPAIDPQQIAAQVRQTLNSEQVWDNFVRDNPEFREEYDDQGTAIVSKQREYGDFIYARDFAPLVERGEISYQEALISTAKSVRDTFSPGIQPPPVPELTGTEQRQQRKQAIDNIAIAAGARSAGAVEEKEESRAEILSNMRKVRGLPA